MKNDAVRSSEILFVKSVKDGIPNRDPLRESDARRLFGPDDGRISLSDVSVKRDVRDYVSARHPDGGPDKRQFVFVRKVFSEDGATLLGREGLANAILEQVRVKKAPTVEAAPAAEEATKAPRGGKSKPAKKEGDADIERDLLAASFDIRAFGAVFSVSKKSFNRVGPVQFGWAHSLHPVETKYVQGTVCMPAKDAKPAAEGPTGGEDEDGGGKTQGTIWTMYQLPFAVFAMPAVLNATIARDALLTGADVDLLLEGLWKGTLHRQARGRGRQQPLLLVHVEYKDPFFRLGYLEEGVRLEPGCGSDDRKIWLGQNPPTDLRDVALNVAALAETLDRNKAEVARVRIWHDPKLRLVGELPGERPTWASTGNGE